MQKISMRLSKRTWHTLRWMFVDAITVIGAYSLVFAARATMVSLVYRQSLVYIILAAQLMVVTLYLFGVYRRIWPRTSGHEVSVIIKSVMFATVLIVLLNLLNTPRPLPVSIPLVGSLLTVLGLTALRYRSRLISGFTWRWRAIWDHEFPQSGIRVLIIGAGEAGQLLSWRLKHSQSRARYEVVGFVDDDPDKQKMLVEGCPVLGQCHQIGQLVRDHHIELIVVAIHNLTGAKFREILTACEQTTAMVKVLPDLLAMVNDKASITALRDVQPEDLIGRTTVSRSTEVDLSPVLRKVVCITGAAGSIGSELVRQIMDYEPRQVILLDNNESGLHDLYIQMKTAHPDIDLIAALADITRMETLEPIVKLHKPEVIFHAAAYKHVPMLEHFPSEALRVNIRGTWNLAELASRHRVERFVLISTDKAVKPVSVMGASKSIGESILYAFSQQSTNQTRFTAVRFGNVLGSRGSVVPTFRQQIQNGGPVTVTHPEMTRYFMSTSEAVNLIIHAACLTRGGDIFMLKMGEVVRITELAERMIRMHGLRPYVDIDIQFTGVRPGEKMHEELYDGTEDAVPTSHPHIVQIQRPYTSFEACTFFKDLDAILANPPNSPSDVLDQLLHIMRLDRPHAAVGA